MDGVWCLFAESAQRRATCAARFSARERTCATTASATFPRSARAFATSAARRSRRVAASSNTAPFTSRASSFATFVARRSRASPNYASTCEPIYAFGPSSASTALAASRSTAASNGTSPTCTRTSALNSSVRCALCNFLASAISTDTC